MKRALAVAGVLLMLAGTGAGRARRELAVPGVPRSFRESHVAFYDDMENGENGWTHMALDAPEGFHVDTYKAFADGTPPDYSWWCGTLRPAFAGGDGYGNLWVAKLDLPPVPWSGFIYPVLQFAYRNDTEIAYDFTHVFAESNGVCVRLNRGYDGVHPWTYTAFYLGNKDNPARCRFRFRSDEACSDEDGGYDSDGGAFACDEILIFDYYTGAVAFYDDVEDGVGLCTPYVAEPTWPADSWHLAELPCRASDGPTCWTVTGWDTTLVEADLENALVSPVIDISGAEQCTLFFALHACVPPGEGDWWSLEISVDGGETWIEEGIWDGDTAPPACDVFVATGLEGVSIDPHLPASQFRMRLIMWTDAYGCGPGASGAAGVFLDDVRVVVSPPPPHTAVEGTTWETTWGCIKAIFRE